MYSDQPVEQYNENDSTYSGPLCSIINGWWLHVSRGLFMALDRDYIVYQIIYAHGFVVLCCDIWTSLVRSGCFVNTVSQHERHDVSNFRRHFNGFFSCLLKPTKKKTPKLLISHNVPNCDWRIPLIKGHWCGKCLYYDVIIWLKNTP